jgi:hypothetical protein
MPSCYPTQYVYLSGISQRVGYLVNRDFEQEVSSRILVIVYVRFDLYTLNAVDKHLVFLMKRKLNIRLADPSLY